MTEVCWGVLAKAVNDKTTVSEEIDADLLTHNNDPSSHSQANESLYNHRIAEILDHLDESITNLKMTYPVRAYNAIVAQDGSGDYTDIQEAIDAVNSAGGGNILIRSGIYVQTTDITLYSNITLLGEDDEDTIIDFNNIAYGVKCVGTGVSPKYNVHLRNLQIKRSRDLTYGALYFYSTNDSSITDCIFTDNKNAGSTAGIDIQLASVQRIYMARNQFYNFYSAIYLDGCAYSVIEFNYFQNGTYACFYVISMERGGILGNIVYSGGRYFITVEDVIEYGKILYNHIMNGNPTSAELSDFSFSDFSHNILVRSSGTGSGIEIAFGSYSTISNNHIRGYSAEGIEAGGVEFSVFSNNVIFGNGSDGIDSNGSIRNTITGNVITNNASRGIYLRAGSNNNEVISNIVYNNTTAQITDSGAGNDVAHNILA